MKSRSKNPRRGFGELVSELVAFSAKAMELADAWQGGEKAVENVAISIRKIPGFGGKGFRTWAEEDNEGHFVRLASASEHNLFSTNIGMKEIVLDLAEVSQTASIDNQLVDFGVRGAR